MVQVIWSPRALRDITAIRTYIGDEKPITAQRMAQQLKEAGDSLGEFPERGRSASGGLREYALIYSYIIRYEVRVGLVRIIRIKHGAQRPSKRHLAP